MVFRAVGPTRAASFKLWADGRNVAAPSLFTGINLEDAQPDLAELAFLPYSRGWYTYSDILSAFSIVIPRNY